MADFTNGPVGERLKQLGSPSMPTSEFNGGLDTVTRDDVDTEVDPYTLSSQDKVWASRGNKNLAGTGKGGTYGAYNPRQSQGSLPVIQTAQMGS